MSKEVELPPLDVISQDTHDAHNRYDVNDASFPNVRHASHEHASLRCRERQLREALAQIATLTAQIRLDAADASWARTNRPKLDDCEDALRKAEAELAALTAQVAKFKIKRDRTGLLISGLKRRLFAALDVERILAIGLREVDHASQISRSVLHDVLDCAAVQHARAEAAKAELVALRAVINSPETEDFFVGIELEAAHQRTRWPSEQDAGKTHADWFWLVGYLAGKCLHAAISGDREKALHHTISTAAALANWHRAIKGAGNMRPGIAEPVERILDTTGEAK